MNIKESILIFLRGLLMGIADIIPGVSGGTIALITGIYERLIKGISSVNDLFVKEIFKGRIKKAIKNLKKFDWQLFIPLLLGIGVAFLALAHVITYLLLEQTSITYAFFFGLIFASAVLVYKKYDGNKNILFLVVGLALAFWFVGLNVLSTGQSLLTLFFAGAIGISAMILPGISGAFILLLLNHYEYAIEGLRSFMFDRIIVFLLGALVGILSFSKLLNYLLKKHKGRTMSFLVGLMIGSLRLPIGKVSASFTGVVPLIIAGIIGILAVMFIEIRFNK